MTAEKKSSLRRAPAPRGEELLLGHVAGVFGVRGEVRLHLENRESTLFAKGREAIVVFGGVRHVAKIKSRPGTGGRIIARIEGVPDKEAALEIVGAEIHLDTSDLPPLDPGEFYLSEVIGMEVMCGELALGKIVEVHSTGPIDVLELTDERYLPATSTHILAIDRERGIVQVAEGAVAI